MDYPTVLSNLEDTRCALGLDILSNHGNVPDMTKRDTPPRRLLRELADPIHVAGVTYQQKWIRCSKPTCDRWHGPYWYAKWRLPATKAGRGAHRSKYIGRELPESIVDAFRLESDDAAHIGREARREIAKRSRARARRDRTH